MTAAHRDAARRRPRHPHAAADRPHRQAAAAARRPGADRPRAGSAGRGGGGDRGGQRPLAGRPGGGASGAHATTRRAPSCAAKRRCWRPAAACKAALDLLGPAPFFVVNGDAFWVDGPRPALRRLAAAFDPDEVDGVLLVHRTFQVQRRGRVRRLRAGPVGRAAPPAASARWCPISMPALQLIAPALLAGTPDGAFSMNRAWDRAMAAGRLRAVVHDGLWFHLSTPADLAEAESVLQARLTGDDRAEPVHHPARRRRSSTRWRPNGWPRGRRSAGGRARADPAADAARRPRAGRGVSARVATGGRCCCRGSPRSARWTRRRWRWPARWTCRRRWSRRSGWRR